MLLRQKIISDKPKKCEEMMTNLIKSYSNYVNSFYSNDVEILKKRKKQSKKAALITASAGVVSAALGFLPKNKMKIPCFVLSAFSFLAALNLHNYTKMADKKIDSLNTNA